MPEHSRVTIPPEVTEPYEVFLNGVPQQAGRDFSVEGRTLLFDRPLEKEGRLGFLRWLSLFLGIAGTYRQNDSVDLVYQAGGRRAGGERAAYRTARDSFARLTESPGLVPPPITYTFPPTAATPSPCRAVGRFGSRDQRRRFTS